MGKYKVVRIRGRVEDTENMLNTLAQDGWKVVCSYAHNNEYLILEKK